jgi:hypothetical protein
MDGLGTFRCKAMQSVARNSEADPVGQDKTLGARPCLTPCLHIDFQAPFARFRDARRTDVVPRSYWRLWGRQVVGGGLASG